MTYGLYFNELIESGQIERFDKDLKRVHDIGSAEILRQGKKKREGFTIITNSTHRVIDQEAFEPCAFNTGYLPITQIRK